MKAAQSAAFIYLEFIAALNHGWIFGLALICSFIYSKL